MAYAKPETKVRDRASYVLQQEHIRFVLTAPMGPEGEITEHVHKYNDSMKGIALRVPDVALISKYLITYLPLGLHPIEDMYILQF